jgi:hypothetical protein
MTPLSKEGEKAGARVWDLLDLVGTIADGVQFLFEMLP